MRKISQRLRLLGLLHPETLFDARIEGIVEEETAAGKDIVFELGTLHVERSTQERMEDGRPCAVLHGRRLPARLRFMNAQWLSRTGIFERLDDQPLDSGARQLFSVAQFRTAPGQFYWLSTGTPEPGDMTISASGHALELEAGEGEPVEVVRRWSNPPPIMPGLAPHRPVVHRRYGGDPIAIHLGRRVLRKRLFIGGLSHQRERRPAVDCVLNLCGLANPWIAHSGPHTSDRYTCKGEGPHGMDAAELIDEAAWVVERLRAGKRVLVHCYAGMNRSTSVCCAALMMLEGISAEEALARVRERHRLAWPDPYHWFVLEWLSRPESVTSARGVLLALPGETQEESLRVEAQTTPVR